MFISANLITIEKYWIDPDYLIDCSYHLLNRFGVFVLNISAFPIDRFVFFDWVTLRSLCNLPDSQPGRQKKIGRPKNEPSSYYTTYLSRFLR